jgi:hypothetical protein
MNQKELKRILYDLRSLVDELETAVLADPDSYRLNIDYDEVVKYYQNDNDDDEEGL